MDDFFKCFVREGGGAWRCVRAASIDLPEGRIQVVPGTVLVLGSRFMNVDVAALLEQHGRSRS